MKPPIVDGTIKRRRSAAFFHDGIIDAIISALPGTVDAEHPQLYPPITVGRHIFGKLNGSRNLISNEAGTEREAARASRQSSEYPRLSYSSGVDAVTIDPKTVDAMTIDHSLPFVMREPIVTDRLRLRLMTPDDVDDVHSYQSREDVCRYLLFEPRTRELVTEFVGRFALATTLDKDGDYLQLAVELPAADRSRAPVIGDIYFTIKDLENSRGEIGWSLHPDFAGRGYASEAAGVVLDLASSTVRLHRVVAELDPAMPPRSRCASASECARRPIS